MFLCVLLLRGVMLSGVTAANKLKDSLIHNNDNSKADWNKINHDTIGKRLDLPMELAALREDIAKQRQEMAAIKHETRILRETTFQQGLRISLLNQENIEQGETIAKLEKQIADLAMEINAMKTSIDVVAVKFTEMPKNKNIDQQNKNFDAEDKKTMVLKETVSYKDSKTKQMEENLQNQPVLKQSSDANIKKQDLSSEGIKADVNASVKYRNKISGVPIKHYKVAKLKRQTRAFPSTGIAFSAYLSHSLNSLSTGHTIKCDKTLLNIGNSYTEHTGVFTVPRTGVYLLTFSINSIHVFLGGQTFVKLVVDNRNIIDAEASPSASRYDVMGGNTAVVQLTAGEAVWLEIFGTTNGQLQTNDTYRYVTFSGVFLF